MGFHIDYRGETKAAGINYVVTVQGASTDERLDLRLAGATDDGAVLAEGALMLPTGSSTPVTRLLKQAFDAITRLDPGPARAGQPANAYQPWTSEQDDELRAAWLAAAPRGPATGLIRELAKARQRSVTSIRARLANLGCDPDVPGRELGEEAAELLNRKRKKAPDPAEAEPVTP